MENPLQGALQKMGSNFLVAAFVPAMAFIIISVLVFQPILPPSLQIYTDGDMESFVKISFIALLFITTLGFTLYTLSTYVYKAFEGYTFVLGPDSWLRHSFIQRQRSRFKKVEFKRLWVEKEIAKLSQKIDSEQHLELNSWRSRRIDRYYKRKQLLSDYQYGLASERNDNFPPSLNLILPTRFGNILRAAEMYPGERYQIDAVPLWGRLVHVVPEDSMEKVDDANNQCLFLLNVALLTCVFTILCLLASAYQALLLWAKVNEVNLLYFIFIDREPFIYQQRIGIYIFLAIIAGLIAWFFYEASLLNVSQYGSMIRATYDLHRFKLLEGLHLELPTTLREERMLWRRLSYFMVGNDQWELLAEKETLENFERSQADKVNVQTDPNFHYIHQ